MNEHSASISNPPPTVRAFCRDLLPGFVRAVDRSLLLDAVREITATDRWNSFDRFRATTDRLMARFRAVGAQPAVFRVPTGGPAGDGRWRIQEAWDIVAGSVDVTHPVSVPITDYRDNPWTVVQWSAATSTAGIEAELVVVDHWATLDRLGARTLGGKVVLTRLSPYHNSHRWVRHGVRAVISDSPVDGLPAATKWGKLGWGGVEIEHAVERPVGFMLSAEQGRELRALQAEHKGLRVRVRLDVRRYAGSHDVVSGLLPGVADPQDEVWALAHSSEPGAVDNASGIAACLGALDILHGLITAGRLPPPKRSVRCLAGFECYGFFAYLTDRKRLQPPLAGLVVDCVGVRPDACDGTLPWHATVPGSAEFVDVVGLPMLEAALRLTGARCKPVYKPFVSTEDTLLGDPKYGFPCPYLGTYPYRGYHSSGDTVDLIDSATLAAAAVTTAGYLYFLANAESRHVAELASWYTDHVAVPEMRRAESADCRARIRARQSATLGRLQRWLWGGDRRQLLDRLAACRRALGSVEVSADPAQPDGAVDAAVHISPADPAIAGAVPFRRYPLAPTYENVWPDVRARIAESSLPKWALYWVDGSRTIADLRRLLVRESRGPISIEQVHSFFAAMADIGYVALVPPEELVTRERLVRDLRALGLKPGMDVIVHSSLSRIGWVKGGAETVVDALLDVLGPEGTLMMPSFNHRTAGVFNPLTTPTINGAVPDAFWRRPEAVRSLHPTHALAAVGPKAEEWLRDHLDVGIWAAESPLGRLIHGGGWILGLGVDHTSSTAYHIAEISMNAPCLDQFGAIARIVDAGGSVREVKSLAWRGGVCPAAPAELNAILDRRRVQRHGRVGRAECVLVKAIEVWSARRAQIQDVCPNCSIRPNRSWPG